jgi:hypothetical protein
MLKPQYWEKNLRLFLRYGQLISHQSSLEIPVEILSSPVQQNLDAMHAHYVEGDLLKANNLMESVFSVHSNNFGCHDSFLDIAGSLSDLAVINIALERDDMAVEHLKRALHMTERSYKVNRHLQSCLLANLTYAFTISKTHMDDASETACMARRKRAMHYSERLARNLAEEMAYYDAYEQPQREISTEDDLDGLLMNRHSNGAMYSAEPSNSNSNSNSNHGDELLFVHHVHPQIRRSQCFITLASSLIHNYDHFGRYEEGVLRIEQGLEQLNRLNPLPKYFATAIVKDALITLHKASILSQETRGVSISTSHLDPNTSHLHNILQQLNTNVNGTTSNKNDKNKSEEEEIKEKKKDLHLLYKLSSNKNKLYDIIKDININDMIGINDNRKRDNCKSESVKENENTKEKGKLRKGKAITSLPMGLALMAVV